MPIQKPTIEILKLQDLTPADYNPRGITDQERAGLQNSLERFGLVDLPVWNRRTGNLVGGHQRREILIEAGETESPVVVVDLEIEEEKALNLALNSPALAGHFTVDVHDLIAEIEQALPEAFEALRLEELEAQNRRLLRQVPVKTKPGQDDVPEPPEDPTAKLGDIWELGRHRLICADSLRPETYAALMDGRKAHIVITDPPYGVGYDCSRVSARKRAQRLVPITSDSSCEGIRDGKRCNRTNADPGVTLTRHHVDGDTYNNDPSNIQILCKHCHAQADLALGRWARSAAGARKAAAEARERGETPEVTGEPPAPEWDSETWDHFPSQAHFKDFLVRAFNAIAGVTRENAAWYVWHASSTAHVFREALAAAGIRVHQAITWVKPTHVMGFSVWNWRCEPCYLGRNENGERKPWSETQAKIGRLIEGLLAIEGPDDLVEWERRAKHLAMGWVKGHKPMLNPVAGEYSNVWEAGWEGRSRSAGLHPTQKPVRVFELPLMKHTRPGHIILDAFCGSGTSLIAAELTGRRCYAVERNPAFIDIAVRRWEDFTGGHAELVHREEDADGSQEASDGATD